MDNLWKFLTFAVAVLGSLLVYQQLHVNREKLKLDLFEKRFVIFVATKEFLANIAREAKVDLRMILAFKVSVAEADFLFDSDITEYLDDIARHAAKLDTALRKLEVLPLGSERDDYAEKEAEEQLWLTEQLGVLNDRFARYMKFQDWRSTFKLPLKHAIDTAREALSSVVDRVKHR